MFPLTDDTASLPFTMITPPPDTPDVTRQKNLLSETSGGLEWALTSGNMSKAVLFASR